MSNILLFYPIAFRYPCWILRWLEISVWGSPLFGQTERKASSGISKIAQPACTLAKRGTVNILHKC